MRLLDNSDYNIDVVVIVFDRYDKEMSIKQMERDPRGAAPSNTAHQISGKRSVPNYRLFLKCSANNAALAVFLCENLASTISNHLQANKSLIVSGGFKDPKMVKMISNTGIVNMDHLFSTHKKADTRIVLHATDLAENHCRIIVRCNDTDVLILLLYYRAEGLLPYEVFMHSGHSGKLTMRVRYAPVHTIAQNIDPSVLKCFPVAHALTGCDTTISFFKIRKQTAFNKLSQNIECVGKLS